MAVFENDIERNVLRLHRRAAGMIDLDLDKIVGTYAITNVLEAAINLTLFGLYQFAKIHLAKCGKVLEQEVLEPHFMMLGGSLYLDPVMHDIHFSVVFITKNTKADHKDHKKSGPGDTAKYRLIAFANLMPISYNFVANGHRPYHRSFRNSREAGPC